MRLMALLQRLVEMKFVFFWASDEEVFILCTTDKKCYQLLEKNSVHVCIQ